MHESSRDVEYLVRPTGVEQHLLRADHAYAKLERHGGG
jgi:hypothetical protein